MKLVPLKIQMLRVILPRLPNRFKYYMKEDLVTSSGMLPPNSEDACLKVHTQFVLSIYGTKDVLTADGDDIKAREYTGNLDQIWVCVQNKNNAFGFISSQTWRYIGMDIWGHLTCVATEQKAWECLTFTALNGGGYRLSAYVGDKLCPVTFQPAGLEGFMQVTEDEYTRIGLHQVKEPVFRHFRWVVPNQLARASAPHYEEKDEDQYMDQAAIDFLVSIGINHIVSLNSIPFSRDEVIRLKTHQITYCHLPVPDFGSPTIPQLERARDLTVAERVTLVYCGYGHGRSGTFISAVQLYLRQGNLDEKDYRANMIESQEQIDTLNELKQNILVQVQLDKDTAEG